jgi:hypothetical protein
MVAATEIQNIKVMSSSFAKEIKQISRVPKVLHKKRGLISLVSFQIIYLLPRIDKNTIKANPKVTKILKLVAL